MAKVKLTKMALKQQRDELAQYRRFLPTLQLKKQQLQLEMRKCLERVAVNESLEKELLEKMSSWLGLFGAVADSGKIADSIKVDKVETEELNIAGVEAPRFLGVVFNKPEYDTFASPLWYDDAVGAVKKVVELRIESAVIRRQYELIADELRTTAQRVNLFEKVKMPECRENIRVIGIYLGDQSTSAVSRSKIAKKKLQESEVVA